MKEKRQNVSIGLDAFLQKENKGSATVEMAYIMPLFLSLFLLMVTVVFYFHDKCVLYATAYETAVIGAQNMRGEELEDAELEKYLKGRTQKKLLFFSDIKVQVKKNLEYLTIQIQAERSGWKIRAEQKAMRMRPEEVIYLDLSGKLKGEDKGE